MVETPTDTSVNLFRGAIAIAINGIPIFNVLNRGENAYEKGNLIIGVDILVEGTIITII